MASQNLARLGIVLAVDSGELVQGITEAQKNFDSLSKQGKRATDALAKDMQQLVYATEDYGKTLTKVQQLEREIKAGKYQGAEQNAIDTARRIAKAYDERVESMKKVNGLMTEQQKLQVGYQVTDFVTQIASGQNAMIAFLQQGGQLKDTMGGIGNAFKAVASIFTPFRIAVGGITAAFGAMAYAAYQGRDEIDKLKDTLTLTGNFAGITTDKFYSMSRALSQDVSISIGSAKDIMQALTASGRFTEATMGSVAKAIGSFAKVSGLSAEEAAQKLIPSFDGSAASAKRLNEQYHFLTAAQYKQIEALERQGRTQESTKIVAEALDKSLQENRRTLGYLEQSWSAIKKVASEAWDAMLGLGRPEQTLQALERVNSKIVETMDGIAKRRKLGMNTQLLEADLAKQQDEFRQLVEKVVSESETAAEKAKKKQEEEAGISRWNKAGGIQGQISARREAEKAELDAFYKSAEAIASEEQRIEVELQKKIAEAKIEEKQRNEDTFGQYAAEFARKRVAKVQEAEAEAEKKRFEYRKKQQWEADQRWFESIANVGERLERERTKIFGDAETRRQEQLFSKEQLEARFSLIGATQKEIQLTQAKIDAQKEFEKLARSQEFKNMSVEDQEKAKQIYEQTMQAKLANIELADSLQRMQGMYDAVWSNMSASIERFVRTGKFSIKDFTRSVIQDMLIMNMRLQAMTLIRGLLGSVFGNISTAMSYGTNIGSQQTSMLAAQDASFRANGGPVAGGSPYIVGERGPELFVPTGSGTIVPNNMLANSGGVTQVTNNYINAIDVKSFEQRLLESNQAIWSANQYASKNLSTNFGRT
jgi:phage-related minor tail protein